MGTKDPYVNIIKTMRNEGAKYNPPSIDIGVVLSDNPLVINLGDLPLTKDNLLIADYLLSNYKREVSIPTTNATSINFTDGLKKDDKVACLATSNGQTYIVLCRVV